MKLIGVTYKNTQVDDQETFQKLPKVLQTFLTSVNGIIAFKGGLHIRGCCSTPLWHSINEAWTGKLAFWKNYPEVLDIDIPFGQDCMGDQFLLRAEKVVKLFTETGEIEYLNIGFHEFLEKAIQDPLNFLGMQPLTQLELAGKSLEPGKLISATPPFALNKGGTGLTLNDVLVEDQLKFLAELSKKLRNNDQEGENDVSFYVN